jgi:glutamyl-tRNA synthetase
MTVRTRMAPSPTGEYHVGHIRTVLYNYAFARNNNGKFIIRIEDTDRVRLVEGAVDRILDVIKDYGLDWDEGPRKEGSYGPYVQSERLDLYKKYAEELVEKNKAYYCFCSKERLDELRTQQEKDGLPTTKYDKKCLSLSKEQVQENLKNNLSYVIRLNVPVNEEISFKDVVFGDITINSNDVDDQVLLKSDEYPSYHLGVVVDDHLMDITHVMRGNDWIPSTPKHVLLYKAFGWEMPTIVHLPNLKELGGSKKLSKRFGSVYAVEFLKEGYLPEALLNFLMFLGWNPGTEKEIYSVEEFIKDFSLDRIQKTDLVSFDRQKLLWMNGHYIREMSPQDLWEKIKTWAAKFEVVLNGTDNKDKKFNEAYMISVLALVQERMKLFSEFNDFTNYFFEEPVIDKDLLVEFVSKDIAKKDEILKSFLDLFENVEDANWTRHNLETLSHDLLTSKRYKPKEAFMTLRVALTGKKATPQIFDMLPVLGKEIVVTRIKNQISN